MNSFILFLITTVFAVLGLSGCTGDSAVTTINLGQNTRIFTPLKSIKASRDENVVKQGFDYSCGAAAMATLLTYGIGDQVSEAEIMSQLMSSLPKDQQKLKQKEGFSLADLQNVALQRGLKSAGFLVLPDYLSKLKGPVIVFTQLYGDKHFTVLRGVQGGYIFLADPSLGNIRMSVSLFLDQWLDEKGKGVILVVEAKNGWPENHLLKLNVSGVAQPEILSTSQLLNVSKPYLQFALRLQ
jgi:predicted double-glycine peptidase